MSNLTAPGMLISMIPTGQNGKSGVLQRLPACSAKLCISFAFQPYGPIWTGMF